MVDEQTLRVDVLIAGGGVAGCGAAIATARRGYHTLLIESSISLGGLATNGYVTGIAGICDGICHEWISRLCKKGAAVDNAHLPYFDPEKGKIELEHMLLEAGAEILYGTYAIDVITEENNIKSVICHSKSGRIQIQADYYVDATGDADIASYAGVPCEIGSAEFGGLNSSSTLAFRMGHVNFQVYRAACHAWAKSFGDSVPDKISYVHAQEEKAVEEGYLPHLIFPTALMYQIPGTDETDADVSVMSAHSFFARNTDSFDLTRQIEEQHDQILLLERFFRKYLPGFEQARLTSIANLHGVRDSRRIVGEYVLKDTDVANACKFDDGIIQFPEGFDTHHPTQAKYGFISHIHVDSPLEHAICRPAQPENDRHPDTRGAYEARVSMFEYCEVPYRCLVPLKINNLLVAGRCMSAEFNALSAVRVIAPAMNTGYAAGIAIDLCKKKQISPRELDGRLVRAELIAEGVPLDHAPEGHWARLREMENTGDYVVLASDMVAVRTKDGIKTHM